MCSIPQTTLLCAALLEACAQMVYSQYIMTPMTNIIIVGAGNVGCTIAQTLLTTDMPCDISLTDIDEGKCRGEVMDLQDGMSAATTGSINVAPISAAAEADIVIITAGSARIPKGGSRLDLIDINKRILTSIAKGMGQLKPSTIVILVTNPVDPLTEYAQELFDLPSRQIMGTGTLLDTARMKTQIAEELSISPRDIQGYFLGEHGQSGFAAWSTVTVSGVPALEHPQITDTLKAAVNEHVRGRARAIIDLKGATYYGIAAITTQLVHAIISDDQITLPISTHIDNQLGISDVSLSLPVIVGKSGAIPVQALHLPNAELAALRASAEVLKKIQ